jgi:hypothetical protein
MNLKSALMGLLAFFMFTGVAIAQEDENACVDQQARVDELKAKRANCKNINFKNPECSALVNCKKSCRDAKKGAKGAAKTKKQDCKAAAKNAFSACKSKAKSCKQGCKKKRGKARRQCQKACGKRDCRVAKRQAKSKCRRDSRAAKRGARGNKRGCVTECRKKFKTPECIGARKKNFTEVASCAWVWAQYDKANNELCQCENPGGGCPPTLKDRLGKAWKDATKKN